MASRRNARPEPIRPVQLSSRSRAKDSPSGRSVGLMRSLNLFGLDFLDPIVLAALVDERPLLLIGPHGTAKSELLNRLAAALVLSHRHYNASLISFDDLLGYPVPEPGATAVRYLRTPGDLWDAESVFLDEISRCRPETQNKLFSVVHEKRVQGMALLKLRYRWAAMNPPLTAEADLDDAYTGSQPLDPALADRFAYIVELPSLLDLSPGDRLALISDGGRAVEPSSAADLARLVSAAREALAGLADHEHQWAARYVGELVSPLAEAQLAISGRRAVMLAASIASVRAASLALGRDDRLPDCALAALRAGLPQRGQGRRIEAAKLGAIHRAALQTVGEPPDGAWRRIRALRDPVARVAEALKHAGRALDRTEISNLVSEAYASLTVLMEDPNQQLYADRPGYELPDATIVTSLENFRTPRALVRLIDLLRLSEAPIEACSPHEGEVPDPIVYKSDADCIRATESAIHRCLQRGFGIEDVAVVSLRGRDRSVLLRADRLGPWSIRRFSGSYDAGGGAIWTQGELLVESVRRFKGQAAPAVILTECDFDSLDPLTRRLLFVGFTRARMHAEWVVSRKVEELISRDLAGAPSK